MCQPSLNVIITQGSVYDVYKGWKGQRRRKDVCEENIPQKFK